MPRSSSGSGIRLFRIAGIAVVADPSWFLGLALIVAWFALAVPHEGAATASAGSRAFLGLLVALSLFASVLVHELAHCALSRRFGKPVRRIRLFLLGGVSEVPEEPDRPLEEFLVAVAGPAVSLLLGLALLLLGGWRPAFLVPPADPGPSRALPDFLLQLGWVNAGLFAFNLLPAFPLDGGRCLRAGIWAVRGNLLEATRHAAWAGRLIAALLIGAGVVVAWRDQAFGGAWLALIGLFLHGAARSSERAAGIRDALRGLLVADAMNREVATVPATLSLDRAFEEVFLRHRHAALPVVDDGKTVGVLLLSDLGNLPTERWPATSCGAAARPVDRVSVRPADPLDLAWNRFTETGEEALPVLEQGQLVGILTRRDAMLALLSRGGTVRSLSAEAAR
ncbi:MAG: site-2 protease family protein [Planctomycetes bacterium]|nr:site-2 protease family protein [Planctomycetota bacterium]